MNNAEFKEFGTIARAHILNNMISFTAADRAEMKYENGLRNAVRMLNTLIHGQLIPNQMLSLENGFLWFFLVVKFLKMGMVADLER